MEGGVTLNVTPTTATTTTTGFGSTVCIFGQISVTPSFGQVGAVNGTITPLFSTPIPISQVVGPAGGQISLNLVNGRFATVCGTLQPSGTTGCFLNVSNVFPSGFGLGGGLGTGLGTGLGGLGTGLGFGLGSGLGGLGTGLGLGGLGAGI